VGLWMSANLHGHQNGIVIKRNEVRIIYALL